MSGLLTSSSTMKHRISTGLVLRLLTGLGLVQNTSSVFTHADGALGLLSDKNAKGGSGATVGLAYDSFFPFLDI